MKKMLVTYFSASGGFANRAQIEKLLPGVAARKELGKTTTEADGKAWLEGLSL